MNTKPIIACGFLRTLGQKYFLVNPSPTPQWDGGGRCFLVVPITPAKKEFAGETKITENKKLLKYKNVYSCPRIVITTDWSIEQDVSIPPLMCEVPEDVLDTLFDEMINKQGALA